MTRRFWLVMLGLFGVSAAYDRLVIRRLASRGDMELWTWATVVWGVAYTLIGVWLIDRRAAKLAFIAFCFSGLPMSWGDVERYLEASRNGRQTVLGLMKKHGQGDV